MKTTSACLTGVDLIETRERELAIGPDEVLVKTPLAGICGQDKNLYHGITRRFPISKVAEAFAVAAKDPAAIKVVIEFQ